MTRVARLVGVFALLIALPARAETIAVFVGANVGNADDDPLRYAEQDARRMRTTLLELGDLRPERAILVMGGGPPEILAALDEVRGRAAELEAAGRTVSLLFYFSGHGDENALHLPRGEMPLPQLRAALERVPATVRISILDACRTVGRGKGVRKGARFEAIALPEASHGHVELRASSLGEGSQESEELGGAIFTHYLLSALRGAADADHDGQVTLAEAYSYAYRHTLLRTGDAPGLQHPTLDASLSGAGEVVLAHPQRSAARIEVPPGAERYLFFALPSARVMGEVSGGDGLALSVPAGRYLVARRNGGRAAVAEVDVSWGGRRVLVASEFRAISREELQSRGGRIELHPFQLEVRAGVEVAPTAAEGPALAINVSGAYTRGRFEARTTLGFASGPVSTQSGAGWSNAILGRVDVGTRLFLGRVTLSPLVGLALRHGWSTLTLGEAARRVAAGLPTQSSFRVGSIGPGVDLRLGVPLRGRLSFVADVALDALLRREGDGVGGSALRFRPVLAFSVGIEGAL